MLKLAGKFMHHVLPGVVRPLHVLWNQVVGFFFIALALFPLPGLLRSMRDPEHYPRTILSVIFVAIMGGFGIASFWKARRISRRSQPRSI